MKRYPSVQNGELVFPKMTGYRMSCCDCGLVHRIDFELYRVLKERPNGTFTVQELPAGKLRIGLRAYRDRRSTGQIRRHQKSKP